MLFELITRAIYTLDSYLHGELEDVDAAWCNCRCRKNLRTLFEVTDDCMYIFEKVDGGIAETRSTRMEYEPAV